MNTHQVLRFPRLGLVITALVLLAAALLAVLITLAWALVNVHGGPSPVQVDSLKVVDAFHSAVNSADEEAMLALFAAGVTINDGGVLIQGKDQIRDWILHSQRMAGLHLTLRSSEKRSDRVTWIDMAYNGSTGQHNAYLLRWMAVIQEGEIQSLSVSLLPMPDGK
jgi:hypothetical protein